MGHGRHPPQEQGRERMKKTEIVERVAGEAGIWKQAAKAAVGPVFSATAGAFASGDDVSIVGFGRFSRTERPTREGRTPRTGERIAISRPASVSFRTGKALKRALN